MDQFISMKLHAQFGRDTDDKKSKKSWNCLRNGNLKREIFFSAEQECAVNTKSVRKIYRKGV